MKINLSILIEHAIKLAETNAKPTMIFAFSLISIKGFEIKLVRHETKKAAFIYLDDFIKNNKSGFVKYEFIKTINLINLSNKDLSIISSANLKKLK